MITINKKMSKRIIKTILTIIFTIVLSATLVFAENETEEAGNTTTSENTSTAETTENTAGDSGNTSEKTETSEITPIHSEAPANTISTDTTKTAPTQNTKTTATNNTTTTQTTVKSSNANLSNLGINPNDFSGFTENKTSYSVSVPNTVKSVEVYAKAKDSKSTISGTGRLELKEGQNTATVVVTAEDGTTKTYTIIITRLKVGETIEKQKNNENIYLKNIEIEGMNLEPSFDAEKYVYTINFEGEQTSLNITAEANQTSNIVQIIGNEGLIDGENIVTIIVSDAKEDNSVVYQITVNKNLEKQKALQKEIEDSEMSHKIKIWVVRILILVIIIGLISLIIIKHKKSQYVNYEDENEEDLPKSLRKAKKEPKEDTKKKRKKSKGKHGK